MKRLGIKERQRYKDISWLMSSVDVEDVLLRLGVDVHRKFGDELEAHCPDHEMFTGKESSHPKWAVNVRTGKTICRTEGRGSNLVFTVCRLLDYDHPKEAVEFMTGQDAAALRPNSVIRRFGKMRESDEEQEEEPVRGLDDIRLGMKNRVATSRLYEFFIRPPGKPATNIARETVDRYGVFERTWGFYADRAIIPFFLSGELVGFCAVDLLGFDEWCYRHPSSDPKEYKKTRLPLHFKKSKYLFGYDDCRKGADILSITEGPREVMKFWQEGFPDTVGVEGCTLSGAQMRMIAELAPKEVALVFDGDAAGRNATEKIADKLKGLVPVRKGRTPDGLDPKNLDSKIIGNLLDNSELAT